METLERLKPRDWKKEYERLKAARAAMVKGEKGEKVRQARLKRIQQLKEKHTLAEIGWMMGGLSRQRIHQILWSGPEGSA